MCRCPFLRSRRAHACDRKNFWAVFACFTSKLNYCRVTGPQNKIVIKNQLTLLHIPKIECSLPPYLHLFLPLSSFYPAKRFIIIPVSESCQKECLPPLCFHWECERYTVQKEQGVCLVSLMQREIILYMASAICVSSYLADFYLLSKFVSLE
jgi:hypothetical protein